MNIIKSAIAALALTASTGAMAQTYYDMADGYCSVSSTIVFEAAKMRDNGVFIRTAENVLTNVFGTNEDNDTHNIVVAVYTDHRDVPPALFRDTFYVNCMKGMMND